jgi:hypothetical protein
MAVAVVVVLKNLVGHLATVVLVAVVQVVYPAELTSGTRALLAQAAVAAVVVVALVLTQVAVVTAVQVL